MPGARGAATLAIDEDRRSRSFERLADVLGRDEAVTIFELLPPPQTDLATRADLDALAARMMARFTATDAGFETIDARFESIDARFETIDAQFESISAQFESIDERFHQVDQRFDDIGRRLDRLDEGLRDLRGEVVTAIAGQARALVLGVLTATVSIGGLSALLSQL